MKAETTTVLLPRTVYEAGADKDIELEGTLPDYLPGINRIIRADANLLCEDVSIENGKAEVNGKAVFNLLYESDFKQKLMCQSFSQEFTQRFDLKDMPEAELYPTARARCSYVGCKTLNPRRFMLRCRADVGLEIKCMQGVQTVSVADSKGAFFKTVKQKNAVYTPSIVRDFTMEESFGLEGLPPVEDIVYSTIELGGGEVSTSAGAALIRAEAAFKCLYEKEGDGLQLFTKRFPVSFSVDDDCLSPDSDVSYCLSVKSCEAEKDIDAYGENRVVRLSYGVRVALNCVNRQELELPQDMFFEEYENENKQQQIPFEQPTKETRHRFTLDKVFEIPEMALQSCTDLNVGAVVSEAVVTDEGISVKGSCGINVFGAADDGYRAYDCNAAFGETVPFTKAGADCRLKVSAEVQGPTADISGGRLSVRIPIQLNIVATYKENVTVLASAEIEKRTDSDLGAKPIIIYYPQKGESAWDIGRRYYVDPKTVAENNSDAFDKNGCVASSGVMLYM